MVQRLVVGMLVLGLPGAGFAQGVPERLLSKGTQLYLRWDGFDAHREAFDKSAIGKMMAGDTGKFLTGLMTYIEKQIDSLAGQSDPQIVEIVRELPKFFHDVGKNGFRLGVEVGKLWPVEVEGMLIFPRAAKKESSLFSMLKKGAARAGIELQEKKIAGRSLYQASLNVIHIGWWAEGDDAVVVIAAQPPEKTLERIAAKGPAISDHPLYRELKAFREFPVWADGYLDLPGLWKVVGDFSPETGKLIDELGLKGFKSVTFHSGFDGPAERSVVICDLPGPRKGLLRIATRKTITLADLPPLPPDLTSFYAANLDLAGAYDIVLDGVEAGVKIYLPNFGDQVREGIKVVEAVLGVKLRDELFGSLGDVYAHYNTPADGPLNFGKVYLVKVKDAKKLQTALENLLRAAGALPFVNIQTKKNDYHGAEISEVRIGGEALFYVPSFTIHKGWLALSYYPQPIQGFVLRSNGALASWKASTSLEKRLAAFPKEFVGISISDPRPTVRFLLSLAPTGVSLFNTFTQRQFPGANFDVSLIPNAHEATRHLFPNITVTTDDGRKMRIETRASLPLPF